MNARSVLLLFALAILMSAFSLVSFAQSASATWNCTPPDSARPTAVVGEITAEDAVGSNFSIRDYTGLNNGPLGTTNMRWWPGSGVSWGPETEPVADRYIQFTLTPKTGNSFTVSSVSFSSAGGGTGNMKALVYVSNDPTFATKWALTTDTLSLPHATNVGPATYAYTHSLTANSGQSFHFRIYPWYTGSASSSKYVYTQLVTITGTTASTSAVDDQSLSAIPTSYQLGQNYPNPFNPTTAISYQLPAASTVKLTVYNLLGVELATLVNGTQEAGTHIATWDATGMPSGIYFYKIDTGNFTRTMKMVLQK